MKLIADAVNETENHNGDRDTFERILFCQKFRGRDARQGKKRIDKEVKQFIRTLKGGNKINRITGDMGKIEDDSHHDQGGTDFQHAVLPKTKTIQGSTPPYLSLGTDVFIVNVNTVHQFRGKPAFGPLKK